MSRPKGSKNHTADGEAFRNSVDSGELRAYIERVEEANYDLLGLRDNLREIYVEIKAAGYDVATVRAIVRRRAMDPEKLANIDALMDEYRAALGVLSDTPLGEAGADRIRNEVRV